MDVIETIKRDKEYLKYKHLVKSWEKEFKIKHLRIPSKFDIKEAPSNVRYAYKQYFQLKSAALESSLIDCETPDHSFSISPDFTSISHSLTVDCPSPGTNDILDKLPSGEQLERLLSEKSPSDSCNRREQKDKTKNDDLLTPYTENLSKKLFKNSKFSLRNPRKSLSVKSSQAANKSVITDKITVLSLESQNSENDSNLLHEEFLDVNSSLTTMNSLSCTNDTLSLNFDTHKVTKDTLLRQINEGWLERASGLNISMEQENTPLRTLGIRNLNIQTIDKACDYIENSESESEDYSINKLKPALKKRKVFDDFQQASQDTTNVAEPIKISNVETHIPPDKKSRKTTLKSNQTACKNVNENEQPPDPDEFLPFGIENSVTPRHSKDSIIFNTKLNDNENVSLKQKSKKCFSKEDRLEEKIKNGTLNENFVKINIEKKVFVRGKKSRSYSTYKKQMNKNKKKLAKEMEFPESGKFLCFKCGREGHMARYCTAHRGDSLLPLTALNNDTMPTLQDMQTKNSTESISFDDEISNLSIFEPTPIPESFLKMLSSTSENATTDEKIKPIYNHFDQETSQELVDTLQLFGHGLFRSGQEQVIKRILCGLSTLLILSTGGGKSLCYQLPAYIYSKYYKCITLVISPLVSLMEDQVLSMPDFLKAGCLHTNQPPTVRKKIIQLLKDGEINILLISPEALVSGDGSNGFGGLFKALPPIAFACIDEAHCVSQWSHNFRPSYLMICRVLKEKLKVNCILGLTATASQPTITSIVNHIQIPDGMDGVVTNPTLPDNLTLSVSYEKDKDRALITLLNTEPINSYQSIIVYCIRRDECERIAAVLRSSLQESGKRNMESRSKKRKRMSYVAEAYHAGMSAAQRKKIQSHFMDGTLRIIVATVAFGMGINKADIRCIIHYNMPSSFESYVQEVGRAGRDGDKAHCHVLMNHQSNDKNELLKHIHSNAVDRNVIRKLLEKVFIPCDCGKTKNPDNANATNKRCNGHEVSIPIDETVEELDIASENIATLLCYLELHPKAIIKVLNNTYTLCKIFSYGGPGAIIEAAKKCQPLAMACKLERRKNVDITKSNIFEFPVIDVAAAIGWESGMTKYHLKNLEWTNENGVSKRSQFTVEFNTLGFRIKAPGDLTSTELDDMLDDLHRTVQAQEKTMLYQLEEINKAFYTMGKQCILTINFSDDHEKLIQQSNELKTTIRNYFQRENILPEDIILEERPLDEDRAKADIRSLISAYRDCHFTGRSIARIFQGISSPNYPAIVWGRCKFWRSHMHEDFYGLVKLATQQLIEMKLK